MNCMKKTIGCNHAAEDLLIVLSRMLFIVSFKWISSSFLFKHTTSNRFSHIVLSSSWNGSSAKWGCLDPSQSSSPLGVTKQLTATADCRRTYRTAQAGLEINWNPEGKGEDAEFTPEGPLPTANWRSEGTFCSALSSGGLFSNGKTLLPDSPASSARRLAFPSFCSRPVPM